ncbi:MAG TPA: PBP1A family penicillin-binding protein [Vicinamibacterales bacterium]|nr:PBP1A family penicillin-binding protein [Vicinamibacterales bacterium]
MLKTGTGPLRDRIAKIVFAVLVIVSVSGLTWLMRQTYVVYKLRRGVGDTWFLAADGTRWFRLDEHRHDVPLADIPPHVRAAFVAVEDHRFYHHIGVDPLALGRAIVRNVSTGSTQGASTLTQQLARTLFLSNQKSYGRKLKEAILAVNIDAQLTKDQVLELYLNRIYLSAGVYGVETMARSLFGRPARTLTIAEGALIAGLARAPSALSPWSNLDGAIERSHVVLTRMREEGFITEAQEREAKRARIRIRPYPAAADPRGGYAKEYLRQQFRDEFGGDHPPDWEVHTTFVPELQDAAERAVSEGLRRFGDANLQAALVAVDPETGDILAMVGGRDFRESQFNRAARSRRQPGSAFKPFLFAAALEGGYSPVSVLSGLANIAPQGPEEWSPRNSDGEIVDAVTIREAVVRSNNRAATALQQRMGSRPVLRLASDVGMHDLPDVPSLSLGSGVVTPIELTVAFAAFPNGGYAVRPRAIKTVINGDGATALLRDSQPERVISEQTAFQMVSILEDVLDRGTASAARSWGITFAAGGKTGTTNDFKDAWFVGFSSSIVVGVWVGFDQPKTIAPNAYGSRYALPLWADFMRRSTRLRPPQPFEVPAGMREIDLCAVSYLRPVDGCPVYVEYLKEGDEAPGRLCTIHKGSVKQRVRRAVEGLFTGLGKKLKGIFKR